MILHHIFSPQFQILMVSCHIVSYRSQIKRYHYRMLSFAIRQTATIMISQTDMLFLHLMKTLLLLFFLALGQFVFAQDEPEFPDMRSWGIRNNDTTDRYIFADTALI